MPLVAVGGPAATLIVGGDTDPAVRFGPGGEGSLEGFTLTGGSDGLLVDGASPDILGNVISGCVGGNAVDLRSYAGAFEGNLLEDNLTTSATMVSRIATLMPAETMLSFFDK